MGKRQDEQQDKRTLCEESGGQGGLALTGQ